MRGGAIDTVTRQAWQGLFQLVLTLLLLLFLPAWSLHYWQAWALVLLGDLLVVVGLGIIFLTFRENSYSSAVIETTAGQRVVSTGPYRVVRHPMYAGALVMLLGTPLALGSFWASASFLILLAAIVWRLLDEERLLSRELPGYEAYRTRVKYRLLPLVW